MKIQVEIRGEERDLTVPPGARLLDYLQGAEIPVNAACGGNGTCHKCRVRVKDGFAAITPKDRVAFRESELEQGWRLSCQSRPKTHLAVSVPATESLRSRPRVIEFPELAAHLSQPHDASEYALVCDLGSTGVVVAVAHAPSRKVLVEAHLLNRQVRYGSDVMTRLHSAQKLGVEPLRDSVVQTLEACVKSLEEKAPALVALARPRGMFASGNSAMTTFLLDWPIDTLAVAPFQPHSREAGQANLPSGLSAHTLPILAGFVGGDTVAGILALRARNVPTPWMLVDIGTNTEVVIHTGSELWFSSAPAGPAFEGGNISQGMRAENGAISVAHYADGAWKLQTIGGDLPRGICGSGLMDLLDEGVRAGLIHKDGYLPDGRMDVTPEIGLLADDVREFQLAKAATRTAIDLLIDRAQTTPKTIYLAGTFAQNLRLDSVMGIGLLPPGIPVEVIGNASLAGTLEYASLSPDERRDFRDELERIRKPVELALQDDFQERFVKNINFP